MTKKIFLPLLIFAIALLMFILLWSYRNLLLINSNITKPERYPFITLFDITSGRLSRSLSFFAKVGRFPKFPSTVKPMSRFLSLSHYVLEDMGWASIELFRWDIANKTYLDPSVKPYRFVAYYRTIINKEDYYVLVEQWLNSDGSFSFVPYVVNQDRYIKDGNVNPYYLDLVDPKSIWFPSPITKINFKEVCLTIPGAGDGYCDWYFQNSEKRNLVLGSWPNSASVPKIIERYPILPFKSAMSTKLNLGF